MKKLLGMALVLALAAPACADEILKNLKFGGQLDFQANSARNVLDGSTKGGNDRIGTALPRILLNAEWDLLDDIHARASFVKNDSAWGSNPGGGPLQNAAAGAGELLQQANIKVDKLAGQMDAVLGRQFYGDSGDLIVFFGPKNTYGLYVTAIDALRADWANELLSVSALAGKISGSSLKAHNTATGAVLTNDRDLRGIDVGILGLPLKTNLFVWNQVTHSTGPLGMDTGKNDYLWVYGIKLRGETESLWVDATLASNAGECRVNCNNGKGQIDASNYSGKAFLLDAGGKIDLANLTALMPWVNFGIGSGRGMSSGKKNEGFQSIASDYRPGIINGRFNGSGALSLGNGMAATVGLNNRVVYGLGLKAVPAATEKLELGLSLWDFRFQKATDGDATFVGGDGFKHNNKHIGSEIGLTADWNHSETVRYGVGYARFNPGGYLKENINQDGGAGGNGDNPVMLVFADLSLKF